MTAGRGHFRRFPQSKNQSFMWKKLHLHSIYLIFFFVHRAEYIAIILSQIETKVVINCVAKIMANEKNSIINIFG